MNLSPERLDTDQKALEVNFDNAIYGTFAEIGAGQEVARYFFKVGAAAGTIAKTMSAYDKVYSDEIYGLEPSGRYVSASRLNNMLSHEYDLLVERLSHKRPESTFFAFSDTISTLNYNRTNKGHGWMGVRFQTTPGSPPNDFILHVKMLDTNPNSQQKAIGILGVNMLYACYKYHDNPEKLIISLMDHLRSRVEIDMIELKGPDFDDLDDRLIALYIVQNGLTEVAMFDQNGRSCHASEYLYKKALMVVRGHYHPPTLVSEDVFDSSFTQFKRDFDLPDEKIICLAELTLDSLRVDGKIDYKDFLHRAKLINTMGHSVFITNCQTHQQLVNYVQDFKVLKIGMLIGVRELQHVIETKYNENVDKGLLKAFGELFTNAIRIYVYPALDDYRKKVLKGDEMSVPEGAGFLYKHLLQRGHIVPIENFNAHLLNIFPWEVLDAIKDNDSIWEAQIPARLVELIKKEEMFGYVADK